MKRFLMFLVIAIAVVSLGLTIYYFSVDNEVIYIKSSYLVMKAHEDQIIVRDDRNDLVDFRNKSDYTTLSYTIQQDEENKEEDELVLAYNEEAGYILAQNGGEARIVVSTNNRSYAKLIVDVVVCDGSAEYPYLIRNEEELLHMENSKYSYKLDADIKLTGNWTPISIGPGNVFDGNYHTIDNMIITDNEVQSHGNVGFASTLAGTIKNLYLTNIKIDVNSTSSGKALNIGAFAGYCDNGIIQTSEANGLISDKVTSSHNTVGGIAGTTTAGSKIDRCGFDGTGSNQGIYVTGANITAGGIVGENAARITESYSRGKVDNGTKGNTFFGGIAGKNSANNNIIDCYFYATENLTNPNQAAGIIYEQTDEAYFVTGCYYGGAISILGNDTVKTGNLDSRNNKYLNAGDFKIKENFVTIEGTVKENKSEYKRLWNFSDVWSIPTGKNYPILNITSSAGSVYGDLKDINPKTESTIDNIETLYKKVQANDANYAIDADTSVIDASENNFKWKPIDLFGTGDDLSDTFTHAIISQNGCTIKNLTIDASETSSGKNNNGGNVGLVQKIGKEGSDTGIFSGIKFQNVTIVGNNDHTYKYVGVIAGESLGSIISYLTIDTVNVDISGTAFGTLYGYADGDTKINRVNVANVNALDGYYTYAGGLVGINYATITSNESVNSNGATSTQYYNVVDTFKVVANYAGGVAAVNAGSIACTIVYNFSYNNGTNSNSYTAKIYNSGSNLFVGGIIGANEFTMNSVKTKGSVSNVYSVDALIEVQSGNTYKMYLGGVAGYNSNQITRAYVQKVKIKDYGSNNAFAGGITGYNSGLISYSVVDATSRIETAINESHNVGTTVNGNNYILNTNNCTMVGGLVGYDTQTTNNSYSVYKCASLMSYIKGFYAGGLVGIAFGKVQYSYCGESTIDNGGVEIHGFFAGGLTSVIAGGYMKNCYTFCRLYTDTGTYSYENVLSVVNMKVSAVGGLAVFALNAGTLLENCYTAATFASSNTGVSYGSSADLTGFVCGTVQNCAYLNAGRVATRYGTQLTKNDFQGVGGFSKFKTAIGGDIYDWTTVAGSFPTIDGVNVKNANSSLPRPINN